VSGVYTWHSLRTPIPATSGKFLETLDPFTAPTLEVHHDQRALLPLRLRGRASMRIGGRLRELHIAEDLSQGDIEKRTGLPRAYTSRVENGHASPSIASLEKYATALDVPLYGLFYDRRRGCEFNLKPENKKTKWARPSTNGANMTCSSERLPS
jgi:hypothetical protein